MNVKCPNCKSETGWQAIQQASMMVNCIIVTDGRSIEVEEGDMRQIEAMSAVTTSYMCSECNEFAIPADQIGSLVPDIPATAHIDPKQGATFRDREPGESEPEYNAAKGSWEALRLEAIKNQAEAEFVATGQRVSPVEKFAKLMGS